MANKFSENMIQFKHLQIMSTNENCMLEGITNRLNSGNACYYSVQMFWLLVGYLET